jgi:alginate O-acetyltransferase complex protein AlgI
MLFNSGEFLKFFAAFLLLYWLVRNSLSARNVLILGASYYFYGSWDYRFLSLLFISSMVDYTAGLGLTRCEKPGQRKAILAGALGANLVILGFFKYYGFFVESMGALLGHWGIPFNMQTLRIVLPVGISFYTFQTMSYSIDVYRGEIRATRNLLNFLAYVSFFPQLVAGPIERGRHLLPQFERTQSITLPMMEEGIWLMLWGMFKKVALADNLAPLVDLVYQNSAYSAPGVVLGTVAFALQIYLDFSGYSDIARGSALVLGFDIMVNFNLPYVAKNLREFWQRWHISLSTWLRDYLYIPLGGNRKGKLRTNGNLLTTMVLGGLWHGAAWNFVLWGVWHGVGLVAHRLLPKRVQKKEQPLTSVPLQASALRMSGAQLSWILTMLFVLYGWLLFRARSVGQIVAMTSGLGNFSAPAWIGSLALNLVVFAAPVVVMEFYQARNGGYQAPLKFSGWWRAILEGLLLLGIIFFWQKDKVPFIYFQF